MTDSWTWVWGALAAVATAVSAIWSVAQIAHRRSSFTRHTQWAQIRDESPDGATRDFAEDRRKHYLLNFIVLHETAEARWLRVTIFLVIEIFAVLLGLVSLLRLGDTGAPFEYDGLSDQMRRIAIMRDLSVVVAIVAPVVFGLVTSVTQERARIRFKNMLGMRDFKH